MRKIRFTKSGYEDLIKDQKKLEDERINAVKELQRAREMGDLSENAAYKVARSKLSGIDNRLRRVNGILKRVEVVKRPIDGYADIGSKIIVESDGLKREIILVDGFESDFIKGKISIFSPIGIAIRGKRKGDKILVNTPKGTTAYLIISIL